MAESGATGKFKKGCLTAALVGVIGFIGLIILGAVLGGGTKDQGQSPQQAATTDDQGVKQSNPAEEAGSISVAKTEAEANWPKTPLPKGAPEAPITGACSDDICITTQVQFANSDWPKAWSGEYAPQRNAAYCRKTGCRGAVQVNVIEACAWRMLILASHTMEVDDTDTANFEMDCNTLGPTDLDASRRKAKAMIGVIEG